MIAPLSRIVALRLACQWSPQQWYSWTPLEVYQHRVRVFTRSVLQIYLDPEHVDVLKRMVLVNPLKTTPDPELSSTVDQPPPYLAKYWAALDDLEADAHASDFDKLANSEAALALWRLLPGITTLQQLVQPLLEALVLADRVWKLEDATSIATLVRLFCPKLSPRCMVLMAIK